MPDPSADATQAPLPGGPDFLGVGLSRSGTTSINAVLARHSAIWTPPVKEMHFFDRFRGTQRPLYRIPLQRRLFRRTLLWAASGKRSPRDIAWHLRYLAGPGDDAWYGRLFQPRRAPVMGEISPNYCVMPPPMIAHLGACWPGLKIVFVVREPLGRIWSVLKHRAGNADPAACWGAEATAQVALRKAASIKNDYALLLDRWGAVFPQEHVFVGFYDDLIAQPTAFYKQLFAFLGVDPPDAGTLNQAGAVQRNSTGTGGPPAWLATRLAGELRPGLARFAERYPEPGARWLADCDAALRAPAATPD